MVVTVIDSGIGGISFARNVSYFVKDLDIKLLIDKEGFPYGNKELTWLKERLLYLVDKSLSNTVIIACNTLSSLIFHFDLYFNKTVVDVITPTIYFLLSKNYQNIYIFATKNTLKMDVYSRLLDTNIFYIDSTELISDIEKEIDYNINLNKILIQVNDQCDCILLGCTHLIAIKDVVRSKRNVDIISQDEIFIDFFNKK